MKATIEIIEELLERFCGTIFSKNAAVRSTWNELERLERSCCKRLNSFNYLNRLCGTMLLLRASFSTSFVPPSF